MIPKMMLWFHRLLKSCRFISRPARNMIYNKPTVSNNMMLLSLARRLNPCGPIINPARINPTIWGILNLPNIKGVSRIMSMMSIKTRTGFSKGKVNCMLNGCIIDIIVMIENNQS